jgi:NAD+ diphosphatase
MMHDLLLGYAGAIIDRAAARRRDTAWLAAALRDPASRLVRFHGDRPRLSLSGNPQAAIAYEAPERVAHLLDCREAVLLGVAPDGCAVFAGACAPEVPEEEDCQLVDLRGLAVQGLLAPGDLNLLAQGRALLNWHQRHRFCANCGQTTVLADAGYRRHCEACGANHFPRTDPVVIMTAVRDGHCLLGRQPHFLPGVYSTLAGFVEPGESLEDAARREIMEESGIRLGAVRYHASQPWPFPSSLMIGMLGEAETSEIVVEYDELEDARWFHRDEVRAMLANRHPDGLKVPPAMAIAHHLITAAVSRANRPRRRPGGRTRRASASRDRRRPRGCRM